MIPFISETFIQISFQCVKGPVRLPERESSSGTAAIGQRVMGLHRNMRSSVEE